MDIFLIQTNLQILYIKSTNFTDLHGLTFESQENCIYHGNIHIYGKWAVPFVQRLIDNDFNLNNSFLDDWLNNNNSVSKNFFSHANCSTINKLIFVLLTLLTCTHNGYFKQRAQFSRYGITNPTLRTDWYAHLLISFFVIRSNLKHKNHFIFAIYSLAFH